MRTNLELTLIGDTPHAIAITSWAPGEGKSVVTSALAVALARSGRRVVAVDADLRRPRLHARLGRKFGPGLADLPHSDVASILSPTSEDRLFLMPAGTPEGHPADALALALNEARERLMGDDRLLLFDCPPLQGLAETPLILACAMNTIIVVDTSNVKLLELEEAVDRMRATGVQLRGVVINRIRRKRRPRYYARYPSRSMPAKRRHQRDDVLTGTDGDGDGDGSRPERTLEVPVQDTAG